MEGLPSFKEQARDILEFLLFWLNVTRRSKGFLCSSEGSLCTSIASISQKADSPEAQ